MPGTVLLHQRRCRAYQGLINSPRGEGSDGSWLNSIQHYFCQFGICFAFVCRAMFHHQNNIFLASRAKHFIAPMLGHLCLPLPMLMYSEEGRSDPSMVVSLPTDAEGVERCLPSPAGS